jgi:hypothetical protein
MFACFQSKRMIMKNKREMYPLVLQWFKAKPSMQKPDFCKQHHIGMHCLNYWIHKYHKEGQSEMFTPSGGFVPLTIKESLTRETGISPEIELDLPHGIRLRIY